MQKTRHEGIYFRPLKNGRKVYYVRMRLGKGHRPCRSAGFAVADALSLQAKMRLEKMRGRRDVSNRDSMPFEELAEKYYEHYKLDAKARNWPRAASILRTLIHHFRGKRIGAVAKTDLEDFVRARQELGRLPKSINSELIYFNAAMNYAAQNEWIPKAPRVDMLTVPKLRRARIISAGELKIILPQVSEDHAAAILIVIDTGLRLGELFRIRREDIDINARLLHVDETKTNNPRDLPLTPLAMELILKQVLKHRGCMFPQKSEEGLSGRFTYERQQIQHVSPWRFHDLRHNFATDITRVTDPYTALKLTGHTKLESLAMYLHSDLDRKRTAIEKVGRAHRGLKG